MSCPRVAAKTLTLAVSTAKNAATIGALAPAAPLIEPATRKHAALPPPPVPQTAGAGRVAATSSTPQTDKDAVENVIELVRKHQPADATQG